METSTRTALRRALFACGVTLLFATEALAGIHTWDVREVFSNADGSIQFVELFDAGAGVTEVNVGNGSLSSTGESFSWSNGTVAPPTNGKSYLIATQTFADLPGAPTPDVIIPLANIPFFNPAGDTISFAGVDSLIFGAVPTNGIDSFDEIAGVGANTPKNYAGTQGSVDASPAVPVWVGPVLLPTALLLAAGGAWRLRRTPDVAA